ncbi:hypothetical protein [Deinococcus kurensis]|uniref:hypothetical protein n=1 Tax=Deinococcus kurensis TaxID=2662757 RepID=UPI0012D2D491|nr:hypothetical protein [Deinococcus kurensis]
MARSETLSTWSEGTFDLTEQAAGTLRLPRTFTDVPLGSALNASGVARLGTYDVLVTLDHPASTVTIPATTKTVPASAGTQVTRHVSTPAIPARSYTASGQVFGNTVWSVDFTIPGVEAQEYDVTETVGDHDEYTVQVTPESTEYKDRGFVHVSGAYAAEDAAEEVVILLGDREIARGYDRVPFAFTGAAADCRVTTQDINTLPLVARSARGALAASGFARTVTGPARGTWMSPWIPLRPFDYPATLRASMQAEGRSGSQPNLFIRTSGPDGAVTDWNNQGPRRTDTRVQFLVTLETGQRARSLTWTVETEYPESTYDFQLGGAQARGFGQSYVPDLRATVDGVDVSHLIASVSDGTLVLGIPDGQTVAARAGSRVLVTLDGETVDSGFVVSARRPGSLSGTRLELGFLRSGQLLGARSVYFPGGVNARDTTATVDTGTKSLVTVGLGAQDNPTPTLPFSDEGGFIAHVLANSPGQSQLLLDTRREFRSLDFWTDGADTVTGIGGLGFTEMSDWTQHYGDRSDAGLDVIEQVCAANMLSVFPLEDGNLLVSDLIPAPDKALHDLIDDSSGSSSAYLRFHDDGGFFVPDYRLSVPERSLNLADTSCFVEVTGTSGPSQVNRDVPAAPAYVRFEKNMSPTKQGRVNFSNWSFLNAGGGSKGSNTFDFCDAQGNPIALRIGSEHVAHAVTSQRGQWDVRFEFIKGTLAYEDVDNDGNEVGDNDDVTGYTGVSVIYTLTDRTSDVHIDLTFMVTGEYLVHGTWETLELRGKPNEAFVPKWFPDLLTSAGDVRRRFGFEPRTEQNPFVVSLKSWPAAASAAEQRLNELLPDRVATGLTLREALSTRVTQLSYCGNAQWVPNQFVAVAKPPVGGIGARITHWDVFLTVDCGSISAEVGGEINHSVQVAFLGTVMRDASGAFHTVTHDVTGGDWFA